MRRGILAMLVAIAIGLTMITAAEPASAVTVVTGVKGTATFNGPKSYTARECYDYQGSCEWASWYDVDRIDDWEVHVSLGCFGVCIGTLRVTTEGLAHIVGALFFGSATQSGNKLVLRGTLVVITFARGIVPLIQTPSVTLALDASTMQAVVSRPDLVTSCTLFGIPISMCFQTKNVQMSGDLVSGGISVSGF